ncbi:unnamed protein product [Dracunculus medinensis]|uniref:PWI domain-containing protein n=1 Tax=Dracunculus medinensis TaxID=318479 RepID=A0A0N4UFT8_DRAME|nr:unnamed protein product [Dracunculus medinensis]
MADAGFYRGTSSEQDSRFTDKERKLLKQMRFEGSLDQKICMDRVNLDVVKPWITAKLNAILGMEDDVLIEYVFSQLEDKSLNPKVMQINLTGFLNARCAREFMGELWSMLLEAQNSDDGIPVSLVEQKMKEIQEKTKDVTISSSNGASMDTANSDWKNRYDSLTGGRFGTKEKEHASDGGKDDLMGSLREGERRRDRESDRIKNLRSEKDYNRNREERGSRDRDDVKGEKPIGKRDKEDRIARRRDSRSPRRRESRSPRRRRLYDERTERKKDRSPKRKHESSSTDSEEEKRRYASGFI